MSIETRSIQYGSIFGDWHIEKLLGTGSGGKSAVFSLYRDNNGWREYCALKVVSLIEKRGSQEELSARAITDYSTAVRELRSSADLEVQLMKQLSGKTNIVDYLDHCFFSWKDDSGFGVDLLIRMEKLEDLRGVMRRGRYYTTGEILKIGQDICQALVLCHGKNILHRDIKPENIFFNQDRDYKLGDFGIARIMADSPISRASTGIGTIAYSPAEQLRGAYDHRVDIYSLGLVLYELLNGNRLPFAQNSYISDRDNQIRLAGTPLPPPDSSQLKNTLSQKQLEGLIRVVMKACAFRPEDRYATAAQLQQALRGIAEGIPLPPPGPVRHTPPQETGPLYHSFHSAPVSLNSDPRTNTSVSSSVNSPVPPLSEPQNTTRRSRPSVPVLFMILALSAAVVIFGFFLLRHRHSWTPATCTAPRFCEQCGETSGAPRGHQWVEATCTEARSCQVCGLTAGSALGHSWTEATCHSPRQCTRCQSTEGAPLEHQWMEATCENPRSCTLCGLEDGEALGHSSSKATFLAPAVCSRCHSVTAPAISYEDISFEEVYAPVREHFTDCMNKISRNELKRVILPGGYYTYYDENDQLVMVTVFPHTPGIGSYSSEFTRWYCYMDGEFVYAFYDGAVQHRFSFYQELLIRWRYRPVPGSPETDEVHDFDFTPEYQEWERIVLQEALSFK